jgi:hypothetical protein
VAPPVVTQVEKVSTTDGKPSLTVGGAEGVDPSSISQIA